MVIPYGDYHVNFMSMYVDFNIIANCNLGRLTNHCLAGRIYFKYEYINIFYFLKR